jgi:hypothetical protein
MAKRTSTVTRIPVPNMLGGVSRLPPALRAPNSLEEAVNVTSHFARGLEKRPGTEYIAPDKDQNNNSGLAVGTTARSSSSNFYHWVDRDSDEKYLMIFSPDQHATPASRDPIQIFNVTDSTNANLCSVSWEAGKEADLKTYLTHLDSGNFGLKAISYEDTTIVVNLNKATALLSANPGPYLDPLSTGTNVELYSNGHHRATVFGEPAGGPASGGFPQPPALADINTYWYARISDGGFPSGWYKATSETEWPWYTRQATPFANSRFDKTSMPIRIRNTGKDTFVVEQIPWTDRLSGNPALNPAPTFVGKKITDLALHRGRLWIAAGEQLVGSRTNDLFNFWVDDYQVLRDDDPVDITVGTGRVSIISHLVSFAKALVVFTDTDQQFEVRGEPIISPTNVALLPTTNYGVASCKPVTTNRQMYAPVTKGTATQVHEYYYDEQAANNISVDIAAPVEGWMPPDIRQIVASKTGDALFLRSQFNGHTTSIYLNFMLWNGNEKAQSAWNKWTFESDSVIQSIQVFNDYLYILFKRVIPNNLFSPAANGYETDQFWVERVRIRNLDNVYINDATTELLFEPRLDRQYSILMTSANTTYAEYDPDTMTTTLKLPWYDYRYHQQGTELNRDTTDSPCNVIIKLDQSKGKLGTIAGTVFVPKLAKVTTVLVSGTTRWTHITIPGQFDQDTIFVVGRPYTGSATLSDVYLRDEQNTPVIGTLQLKQLSVAHNDTGYIALSVTPESRSTLTWEYTAKLVGSYTLNRTNTSNDDIIHFKVMASADHTVMTLSNPQPTPMRISSLEFLVNFVPYKRSGAF